MAEHAFSLSCSWNGPAEKAWRDATGLPHCPHCHSAVLTIESEAWENSVAIVAASTHKGMKDYPDFIRWCALLEPCVSMEMTDWHAFKRDRFDKLPASVREEFSVS